MDPLSSSPHDALPIANGHAQEVMTSGAEDHWATSPFGWLMRLASRRRGKAGELIASEWLEQLGYDLAPPTNSGHDRLVNQHKVEIKFSTPWNGATYVFQQLRDQDYEFVFLLGVSPMVENAWFAPKAEAFGRAIPQHGGATGTDTRWLHVSIASVPAWMKPYGGALEEVIEALNRQLVLS